MPPNASLSATDRFPHQVLWGRYTLRLFVDGELAATEVLKIENPLNLIWASPGMHVLTTARPFPTGARD